MADPPPFRRGSSASAGHPPQLTPATPAAAQLATNITTSNTHSSAIDDLSHRPPPYHHAASFPNHNTSSNDDHPVHPSLLQPRVAVVLNVPPPWHPWLFTLRLVSVLPAAWWGLPSLLQLLLRFFPGPELGVAAGGASSEGAFGSDATAQLYAPTETSLATIWCFASGYLSFFFTDSLMSRWLINYTPQATMVRLLTINAANAYITAGVLKLGGGFRDPRLLLPAWIGIATTLTVMYHITHQKINIRKETSTSVNVFSIASFISMVVLLAHMHMHTPDYPEIPLVISARRAWEEASRVVAQVAQARLPEHAEL
ncbi:Fc.00g036400.m01.CDS01 [Cosmosporella sp. VM-42]